MTTTTQADCVILLHGLGRTNSSMETMAEALSTAGYQTFNIDYPSRRYAIETLASTVIPKALKQCPIGLPIHFVTHSLGSILVRYYLKHHPEQNVGRVVMLGPPNQGSEVVDKLGGVPGFNFLGSAGQQLSTRPDSIPNQLGSVDFDLGVIAGNRSINFFLSLYLPGEDDGKVSVERTKVMGMKDHIVMPVTHPFLMKKKSVIQQTLHFLEHGEFKREEEKRGRKQG